MSEKTTEEMVSGLQRQIRALETRATEEDPWVMGDMLRLAKDLEDAAGRTVANLRERGYTWHDIGFELGLSRQAAFNRWGAKKDGEQEEIAA